MTNPFEGLSSEDRDLIEGPWNRRKLERNEARAEISITREADLARNSFAADMLDLSAGGVGLLAQAESLTVGESVKLQLVNSVQRFEKDVRGIVRSIEDIGDGDSRIGIELVSRLTPLEVATLKMARAPLRNEPSRWF